MTDAKGIEVKLKEKSKNANVQLPNGISFIENDGIVDMKLSLRSIGLGEKPLNMQTDDAAFEAWALALHIHCGYSVKLSLKEYPDSQATSLHYNRFLYRAMKFSKMFSSWFSLDANLQQSVKIFNDMLFSKNDFCCNAPDKENAGKGSAIESIVESLFAGDKKQLFVNIVQTATPSLLLDSSKIFRQLPVGLFKGTAPTKSESIFTGGKSAIDLWSITDDSIVIFELKARNKKMGIITELMFYANYVYDVFIADNNIKPVPTDKKYRGYDQLIDANSRRKKVIAFMLTDELHPLITEDVIKEMNRNDNIITYGNLQYKLDIMLGA